MTTPLIPVLDGLSQVVDHYDGFILDLWGVVHDGVTAYPESGATLAALKGRGKRVVLLSNAPRRGAVLVEHMEGMGIPRHLYDDILSSGDAVHQELKTPRDPFFAALGNRVMHIGPERDVSIYDDLDFEPVESPDAADFVLMTGPYDVSHTLDAYKPILRGCLSHGLPMVCANPDKKVIRAGKTVICAGAMAEWYAEQGGRVALRGKPDPAVYDFAVGELGLADRRRIAVVGDSIHTDLAGAHAAGLDAIFCTGGIHAAELGVTHGQKPTPQAVTDLLAAHRLPAAAAVPAFVW